MTRINTNVSSLNAQKTLARNNDALQTSMTRLSTGLRINSGKDDPAGMIAAAIQSNDIASMQQAITNTQNGSQLIGTADSALGQITSLLSDIRGLVTQVGNTAVTDANQIAANQLQVDSALQAIDRISQVTKFQGQKILDGGLDFINTAQNIPQVKNLQINTANLGTTGQLGVTVQVAAHATQADISTSSGTQQASAALTFAARSKLYTSVAGGGDVWLQANSNSSDYDGVQFNFVTGGTAGAETATYNSSTKTLTVQGAATSTWTQVVAAINSDATVSKLFTASGGNSDASINTTNPPLSPVIHTSAMNITALAKGTDYNNVSVKVVSSSTVASGAATASYNQTAKELTITLNNGTTGLTAANRLTDSATLASVATAIKNVTLSDGKTKVFDVTYPTTGGASTDRVFGMVADDASAVANTSVSGYMSSAFSAGTRATASLSLATGATVYNGVTAGTFSFANGAASGTVAISSLVAGTPNTKIHFTNNAAATAAVYSAATNTLTVNVNSGAAATVDSIIAAIIAHTGNAGTFTAHLVTGVGSTDLTANPPADITTTTQKALDIKSTSLSSDADNTQITYYNDATAAGKETAVYDASKKTLAVHIVSGFGGSTLEQIAAAINNSVDTNGKVTNAWKATDMAPVTQNYQGQTISFNDGNGNTGTFLIKSNVAGLSVQTITFTNTAAATGAQYTAATNTLAINVQNTGATVNQVIAAINAHTSAAAGGVGYFSAQLLTGNGTTDLKAAPPTSTTTANSAGAGFLAAPSTQYTSTDTINVQALNTGSNYNNMQVKFQTVPSLSGTAKAVASYDQANNVFTIQVKNSDQAADAVSLQNIADAINLVKGFAGSFVTKDATNGTSQSSGEILGKNVDTQAVANTGSTGGNALLADLAVEVGSNQGQQVFNFKAGATANQMADAINSAADSIGVAATQDNSLVDIQSASYGQQAFVSLTVLSEGAGGRFGSSVSSFRDNGTDANATINGIQASSSGNQLSINTSSLAMTLDLQAGTNGNFNFSILGGGAQFQLGPDVVSSQQLRIGIQSVNSANMGGVDGKLYQLAKGNAADLTTDPNLAAKIVDEAINSVTSLRGRLGAIQGLTMDTNQKTLEDMVQNMQTSLSQIQDTDFAAETANLTRAQILRQSGMAVLSIANQQPQQVLNLLPRG